MSALQERYKYVQANGELMLEGDWFDAFKEAINQRVAESKGPERYVLEVMLKPIVDEIIQKLRPAANQKTEVKEPFPNGDSE